MATATRTCTIAEISLQIQAAVRCGVVQYFLQERSRVCIVCSALAPGPRSHSCACLFFSVTLCRQSAHALRFVRPQGIPPYAFRPRSFFLWLFVSGWSVEHGMVFCLFFW